MIKRNGKNLVCDLAGLNQAIKISDDAINLNPLSDFIQIKIIDLKSTDKYYKHENRELLRLDNGEYIIFPTNSDELFDIDNL